MNDIAVGDVVWLKSGSPAFTVLAIDKDGAHVTWTPGKVLSPTQHVFPCECLTKKEPK